MRNLFFSDAFTPNLLPMSFDRIWDATHERRHATAGATHGQVEANFEAAVDVENFDDHFALTFDVPGFRREDLSLEVEDKTLRVKGVRKRAESATEPGKASKRYLNQRVFGTFSRSFDFGREADLSQIQAQLSDGVLRVRVGKATEVKPRAVEIK